MKVSRRHGRLRLRLERAEVELLLILLTELDAVLAGDVDSGDAVLTRLFPAAYRDDGDADAEYRSLTESTLRSERSERVAACRADLAGEGHADVDLTDPDTGRRWLQVLNDVRLALGTRLEITEEAEPELDLDSPEGQQRMIYHWLTAVQDSLVHALMR